MCSQVCSARSARRRSFSDSWLSGPSSSNNLCFMPLVSPMRHLNTAVATTSMLMPHKPATEALCAPQMIVNATKSNQGQ